MSILVSPSDFLNQAKIMDHKIPMPKCSDQRYSDDENVQLAGDEILLNPKEFTQVTVGDVVEIYHTEEEYSRLLLQITSLPEDFQQKGTVSIEQSIAGAFQLRAYKDVCVSKVNIKSVTLDLVEVLFKDQYFSRSDISRMRNSMVGMYDLDLVEVFKDQYFSRSDISRMRNSMVGMYDLDLVEVFKDQYFSRSDMSRMRNSMINTCVYLNKKIDFSELRAQVNELWSRGDRVTCGVISEDTRIVFRSSTAVVQIFIQMSTEMWDFDINGDLYFEKAVNGFLTDLFAKWREQNCCHDVTIVMFSRTFYEAQYRDEFPAYMQECLQQDYQGRFYEDFYRIVVQNERYEEWMKTLKQLRKLFNEYQERVLNYHNKLGFRVPKARNSTAAQGNFLETLNMSLNLFEQSFMDRNFDRTGKVAVVITPGAGVFEVDRELTNITKQRTIDCGVGSDLVCMGEQPLHAAPLFKFHSKNYHNTLEVGDDYNIPHWMNHSFYTSKNQVQYYSNKSFVPRIKIPPEIFEQKKQKEPVPERALSYEEESDNFPFVDYDGYDAQVFKLPTRHTPLLGLGRNDRGKDVRDARKPHHPQTFMEAKLSHIPRTRHTSDNVSRLPTEKTERKPLQLGTSPAISILSKSCSGGDLSTSLGVFTILEKECQSSVSMDSDFEAYHYTRPVVGSAGSPVGHSKKYLHKYKQRRALINPFAPSRMQFKMTSNRRRWVHAFPTDPHGVAVQTHHVHTYSYHDNEELDESVTHQPTREVIERIKKKCLSAETVNGLAGKSVPFMTNIKLFSTDHGRIRGDDTGDGSNSYRYPIHHGASSSHDTGRGSSQRVQHQKSWMWGPTGEQEWSPDLTTGVDWKSLTIPASLPITTDYLPDAVSLHNDYVVSDYSLLPDEVNSDYYMNPPVIEDEKYYRKQPLKTQEVFKELISQRLAQGFQLITLPVRPQQSSYTLGSISSQLSVLITSPQVSYMAGLARARPREEQSEEVYLSIGRIFHKLTLTGPTLTVTRYRPRHPNPQMYYSYKYRFQAPDSYYYNVSWSEFFNEKLENYNWNYLDQYICTRGEGDYGLMDSLKFWRSRFFVLPCNNPATKKIIEGSPRCDIYEEKTNQELKQLVMGFTRYIEILNKMRRTQTTRQQKAKSQGEAENDQEVDTLSIASPTQRVVDAMLDTQSGIPRLPKQHGLPPNCFISAEVVEWCFQHVKGVNTVKCAISLLQRVLDDGHICHASGNTKHKFIYGFYIYCFVPKEKGKPVKEGCEKEDQVSFNLDHSPRTQTGVFMSESLEDWKQLTCLDKNGQTWAQQSATQLHKYVNVEVDPNQKSERPEWSTARYHALYSPQCGFELQVQWMVSTGGILGELVYNWARKAGACGFHLLPVPTDPFALPTAPDSDPLRGPIYTLKHTVYGYDEETRSQKLLHLQETIIKIYGFMPTSVRIPTKSSYMYSQYEEYQQYVHCTAGMFILIEQSYKNNKSSSNKSPVLKEARYSGSLTKKSSSELRKDYIARQASHTSYPTNLEPDSKIGFLWSWNYMSSKRWRSGNTGDEHFQDTVLKDFRAFCSNEEDRLSAFWDEYQMTYS